MSRAVRRAAYSLALLAVVVVVVRILLYPWPASDPVHSRWLTLEALVEDGSFAIGYRVQEPGGYRDVGRVTTLPSVDVMLDPETLTFYSSKPPFLQVLYTPLVKLLTVVSGAQGDMAVHRASLMRLLLLLVHALPFALCLAWLTHWWVRTEDAGVALFLVALAGFGTFVTTFSNALSNHVPATFATVCALAGLVRIIVERERSPVWFLLAGLGAGFAAALEYPAGTLVVAVLVLLARSDGKRTLGFTLPAALLPLLLSHGIDYVVFGKPLFFATRDVAWFRYQDSYWTAPNLLDQGEPSTLAYAFHSLLGHHGVLWLTPLFVLAVISAIAGLVRDSSIAHKGALLALLFGCSALSIVLAQTDGWYFQSLLPLVGLTALPLLWPARDLERSAELMSARLLVSCALPTLTFYLAMTKSYGGITSGPRWLLWLTPLWLIALAPALKRLLERQAGRGLLFMAFALSLLSVWWPGARPYHHPWTYQLYLSGSAATTAAGAEER